MNWHHAKEIKKREDNVMVNVSISRRSLELLQVQSVAKVPSTCCYRAQIVVENVKKKKKTYTSFCNRTTLHSDYCTVQFAPFRLQRFMFRNLLTIFWYSVRVCRFLSVSRTAPL